MILFLFTIMLMNLNKEKGPQTHYKTGSGRFFCLITVVLILVFINSKPIIGEYISTEKIINLSKY
jgi:NADH-quinone oxidoreductase subunit J